MSTLFAPLELGEVAIKNRVWLSPMCQYSAVDGAPTPWHLVHLGARAIGGAGLVMTEATAVEPEGRISHFDTGIWSDDLAQEFSPLAEFIRAQGALPAIQLSHAGRKASSHPPHLGGGGLDPDDGAWTTIAPSGVAFGDHAAPREMTVDDIERVVAAFADAARRSEQAGFGVVELHAAHGYLIHQFLSPISNQRTDRYGGSFEGRVRLALAIVERVRAVLQRSTLLFVRVSATDWIDGGWSLPDTVRLAALLADRGVDLIDVSSGGIAPHQRIEIGPGYQVPFAREVRQDAGVPVAAVGLIVEAAQAERVISSGGADAVMIGRAMLRDPAWALRAAAELGVKVEWPTQYRRAAW